MFSLRDSLHGQFKGWGWGGGIVAFRTKGQTVGALLFTFFIIGCLGVCDTHWQSTGPEVNKGYLILASKCGFLQFHFKGQMSAFKESKQKKTVLKFLFACYEMLSAVSALESSLSSFSFASSHEKITIPTWIFTGRKAHCLAIFFSSAPWEYWLHWCESPLLTTVSLLELLYSH